MYEYIRKKEFEGYFKGREVRVEVNNADNDVTIF